LKRYIRRNTITIVIGKQVTFEYKNDRKADKMGKSKKFSSGSRAFIYAASRLEPITKTIIELEEDVKDINNRLMNVKSPSTSSIGEQNMRQSELEKELKKYDLRDKKEEILERKRQLKSLSRWIYKMFDKMSPYYKYFIFVTYVKKNDKYVKENKPLRERMLKEMISTVEPKDIKALEKIINEKLSPRDLRILNIQF